MQKVTSFQYFKALSILCYALVGGLIIFSIIVLALTINGFTAAAPDLKNILNIIVPVLAVCGLFGSNAVTKSRLLTIKEMPGLADKMTNYRGVIILRYALLEGPALFSVIACFLAGDLKLLIVTGLIILIMLYRLPNAQRAINELELSTQEAAVINDPNGVIE